MRKHSNKSRVKPKHNDQGKAPIASGFEFENLADGNVLIEFFGDDQETFNSQVMTRECLINLPVVAMAARIQIESGVEAMMAFLEETSGPNLYDGHSESSPGENLVSEYEGLEENLDDCE